MDMQIRLHCWNWVSNCIKYTVYKITYCSVLSNESFPSKWELPCLPPSSLELWRKERARGQLSFWWKTLILIGHYGRSKAMQSDWISIHPPTCTLYLLQQGFDPYLSHWPGSPEPSCAGQCGPQRIVPSLSLERTLKLPLLLSESRTLPLSEKVWKGQCTKF